MRDVFLVAAACVSDGEPDTPGAPEDANRLRRMDRFGRAGFLAGTRAFGASGAARPAEPDARAGVAVGTRHGCRSAITEHAARLAAAARVEDLAPSVFAATVHNTVNGELAMALGLGGVSETIVSGRTAGLEALILGARRLAAGAADRMLVVAAEGVDEATREAWEIERSSLGPRAAGVALVETGAAVLLEASEIFSKQEGRARFLEGCLFFEPDARRAAARFFEWVKEVEARAAGDAVPKANVVLCTPEYGDFLEGNREDFLEGGREEGLRVERFGAAGVFEIARDIARIAPTVPPPYSLSKKILVPSSSKKIHVYVTRDVTGAVAAVALESDSF